MTSSIETSGPAPTRGRKTYEKPKVTRIRLDARCAVLGFCKSTGGNGPGDSNCRDFFNDPCSGPGS
jgi:hypothetical protein